MSLRFQKLFGKGTGGGGRFDDIPREVWIGCASLAAIFFIVWLLGGLKFAFFLTVVVGGAASAAGYVIWKEKMDEEADEVSPRARGQEVTWSNVPDRASKPVFQDVPFDTESSGSAARNLWDREDVRGIPSSNTFSKEFITDSYTLSAHGEPIPQTSAQAAVTTLNVETMLAELNKGGNASGDAALMSRHFLMLNIVGEAYKKRLEDSRMREICKTVGRRHVKEFPEIKNPLKKFLHIDFLPAVPTFQRLATVLTEDMEFDEAIEVCRSAIEYGIDSETADGFEKKIEEIENAQQASSQ